jgi:hypothetical protein
MKTAGLFIYIVMLASIGIACLFFSREIQGLAIKWINRGITSKIPIAKRFVQSDSYLVHLKVVGVVTILAAVFLL